MLGQRSAVAVHFKLGRSWSEILASLPEQVLPPRAAGRRRELARGLFEPFRDLRRHRRLRGVEAEQFLRGGEFLAGLGLVRGRLLFEVLLFRRKFGLMFHRLGWAVASGGLCEEGGESFPGAMQLAAHGVGGLSHEGGDLLVTQFLIRHQQEQQTVFVGEAIRVC